MSPNISLVFTSSSWALQKLSGPPYIAECLLEPKCRVCFPCLVSLLQNPLTTEKQLLTLQPTLPIFCPRTLPSLQFLPPQRMIVTWFSHVWLFHNLLHLQSCGRCRVNGRSPPGNHLRLGIYQAKHGNKKLAWTYNEFSRAVFYPIWISFGK